MKKLLERVTALAQKVADREATKEAVKAKYAKKSKDKALATSERLLRIEEMLGINDSQ